MTSNPATHTEVTRTEVTGTEVTGTQLSPTQHATLAYALEHSGGKVDWLPEHIKGGARQKVLQGLAARDLITADGDHWVVAAAGYAALGRAQPEPLLATAPLEADPEIAAAVEAAESQWDKHRARERANEQAQEPGEPKPRTREHSKQATVIQMLQRPEGATVQQICQITGWQAHTVRGTFAGTFKKKLGLSIVSDKADGGERVYRIA